MSEESQGCLAGFLVVVVLAVILGFGIRSGRRMNAELERAQDACYAIGGAYVVDASEQRVKFKAGCFAPMVPLERLP